MGFGRRSPPSFEGFGGRRSPRFRGLGNEPPQVSGGLGGEAPKIQRLGRRTPPKFRRVCGAGRCPAGSDRQSHQRKREVRPARRNGESARPLAKTSGAGPKHALILGRPEFDNRVLGQWRPHDRDQQLGRRPGLKPQPYTGLNPLLGRCPAAVQLHPKLPPL